MERGAGVEDERTGCLRVLDPGDPRASVAARGVVARGEDDGHRRPFPALERRLSEIARSRGREGGEQVALEQRQQRLRLGIAEAAVVLEHARAVGSEHQAGEQHPDERVAAGRELLEHGPAGEVDQPLDLVAARGREPARTSPCRPCWARGRRRRRACAWSDGLDDADREAPATTEPGRDTAACREKATGRIALIVVSAALLGSALVLIDVRRNRRAPSRGSTRAGSGADPRVPSAGTS